MVILEIVPGRTGNYNIHNEKGKLVYVGKINNTRIRINPHFTGITSKFKKNQTEVYPLTYDEASRDLIALLKQNGEIKIYQPIYNRAQKKVFFS